MKSTWCPAFITGRVTVRRRGGGLGASSTGATHRACSLSTGDPGNSEAVCPSDPMPSSTKSKRSEEHTSELQSRLHLVCRLLLEKKKKKHTEPSQVSSTSPQAQLSNRA